MNFSSGQIFRKKEKLKKNRKIQKFINVLIVIMKLLIHAFLKFTFENIQEKNRTNVKSVITQLLIQTILKNTFEQFIKARVRKKKLRKVEVEVFTQAE